MEHSLAKADFLNNPSDAVVQSLVLSLGLGRSHENATYVWMMTGLTIRMARFLGLHRDEDERGYDMHFQAEMRRRTWWNVCALDMRATEDQGTDLAITPGSYSTKLPSNINDADIWPGMTHTAIASQSPTNTTLLRLCSKITRHSQELLSSHHPFEDRIRGLQVLTQELEEEYFSRTNQSHDPAYLAATGTMRVFLGRLTLLAFLPELYSSSDDTLFVAAIDVLEHNHALNSDERCLPWRWVYGKQQQWHAIVYLLLEICRRPWSPLVERGWAAVNSPWLVPARASNEKDFNVLAPLRRLMTTARQHRESEYTRLHHNMDAASTLEREDRRRQPKPSSSITFPAYFDDEAFYSRWRDLVRTPNETADASMTGNFRTNTPHGNPAGPLRPSHGQSQIANQRTSEHPSSAATSGLAPLPNVTHWPTASSGIVGLSNLSSFLGTDAESELPDATTHAILDFDWSRWLESARGTL
ncbi:uncharacterized protein LTR77_005887 [Saxophila tyrrhenica]|uniref:Xylanolytic transcriptional activator regulatory domain-containing protein n=1 Tax=Saxophila tyrrhenica TaxID=1690608 RepID=A0AAV9PCS7_9PEZI|nr:hypothetical protein LTR77_005887 [Saxophila tyrrhenica]